MQLDIVQPVQTRSRRTYDAILRSVEDLLQLRPFEQICIAQIVAKAGVSTGSFYARFASKEALLPVLYERYEVRLSARGEAMVAELERAASLDEACTVNVGAMAAMLREKPHLMRAVTQLMRASATATLPISEAREKLHRSIETALLRLVGGGANPDAIAAIRTGQFVAVCALREAILFPHAPFAALTASGDLEQRIATMMARYIRGETE